MEKNIGIDIVDIERIEKIYNKFGEKFLNRIFNPVEIEYIKSKNYKSETISSMFSFKESISKAMGTGIREGLKFKDIKIYHSELGAPRGEVGNEKFLLSASHDKGIVTTIAFYDKSGVNMEKRILELYKKRPEKSHKGTFGKSMVIAGSPGMIGAGYLSSMATLKAGCGMTFHYVNKEDDIFIPLSVKHTEVILKTADPISEIKKMDSVLFGPGMGINRRNRELLRELLTHEIKLIIDADGINMLSEDITNLIVKKSQVILTPHIFEFSRLVGEVVAPGQKLYSLAKDFAKIYNVVLVLKDSKTFITDGERTEFVEKENSGLATAGSGDVLAGIISSFVAQGYDLYDASVLGVHVHSYAGEIASKKKSKTGMIASDILESLGDVFLEIEERL